MWFGGRSRNNTTFLLSTRNGYVLKGNIKSDNLIDLDLPIHKYYDMGISERGEYIFACFPDEVLISNLKGNNEVINAQSYRLCSANGDLYISTEESDLSPTIKRFVLKNNKWTLINQVKIR